MVRELCACCNVIADACQSRDWSVCSESVMSFVMRRAEVQVQQTLLEIGDPSLAP